MGDVRFINQLFPGLIPPPLTFLAQYVLDKGKDYFSETPPKKEIKETEFSQNTTAYVRGKSRFPYKTSVHPYRYVPVEAAKAYKYYDQPLEINVYLFELPTLHYAEPYSYIQGYTLVNGIPHGLTEKTRVNNNIIIKSINVRFNLVADITGTPSPVTVRWLLVYDRDCKLAAAALNEIFEENSAYLLSFNAPINHTYSSRFSVIRDKYVTLDGRNNTTAVVNEYIKGEWPTSYALSFSSYPSVNLIKSGAIYLLIFVNDYTVMVTTALDIHVRLRYADSTTKK